MRKHTSMNKNNECFVDHLSREKRDAETNVYRYCSLIVAVVEEAWLSRLRPALDVN